MNVICKITDKEIGEEYIPNENPNLRKSARGIVYREDDGKIAIFYKSGKNQYKLPGGGMENDEDPEKTFKREVLEETGCKIEIKQYLGVAEEYKCKINFKQVSSIFVSKVVEDTKSLNLSEREKAEKSQLIWETPEKALQLITNCYDMMLDTKYESIYEAKFVVLRDRKILEYYINRFCK